MTVTRANKRYTAHKGLIMLDRLDKIVASRRPDQREELMWLLEDLRKVLLRLAGTTLVEVK